MEEVSEETCRKPKKKQKKYEYSSDQLAAAIKEVHQGQKAFSVAKNYRIPYTTLIKKIKENKTGKELQ